MESNYTAGNGDGSDNYAYYGDVRVAVMSINAVAFLPNVIGMTIVRGAADVDHAAYALVPQNMAFNLASRSDCCSVSLAAVKMR